MRWVKRRAELARNDLRLAWTLARLASVRLRIWYHCLRLGTTPEEFRRQVRLKQFRGC